MITVFTPTYNRKSLLPKLYDSLKRQTYGDFEWLIVDDGSTDGTHDLVDEWGENSTFPIRYSYQTNGGKHRAINNGAKMAKGEWFFIVDSDDTLPPDSLSIADKWIKTIEDDDSFAGICGMRRISGVSPLVNFETLDISPLGIKDIIRADKAEIIKTEVLKNYPFPDIQGEYFCAESLILNRIGIKYKFRYFNEVIYDCKYLEGGLSFNSSRIRKDSPTYATLVYKEEIMYTSLLMEKIRASINFWRFIWFSKRKDRFDGLPIFAYPFMLFGLLYSLIDTFRCR
jgi:glycosyltransferase involved in cell wall biosynthesis